MLYTLRHSLQSPGRGERWFHAWYVFATFVSHRLFDKAPQDRGLYLHPDAFGLDESKGLSHRAGRPDLDASLFPKTLPKASSPETTTKAKPRVVPINNEPPLTPAISRGN